MVWNMRSFTATVAIAAFVLEGLAAAPPAVPVALLVVELLEVTAEEEEGDDPTTDADADAGEDDDEDDETEDVPEVVCWKQQSSLLRSVGVWHRLGW